MKSKLQSDYMQRQFHMMSSLGLFYIIIIALFAVPLLGTFVVVLIKGVLDFRYLILAVGIIVSGLAIFYGAKFFIRLFRKIRDDGLFAAREARDQAAQGQAVQIGLLGGLLTLSYGGQQNPALLPENQKSPLLLPDSDREYQRKESPSADPLAQIRELSEMKSEGIIDEDEFRSLKKKLIQDICNADGGA